MDLRSPDIAGVFAAADIDTVVHMSLVSAPSRSTGRAAMKEHNVIGTMQLLGACQRSATVRRVVVRSTTAVYGSSPVTPRCSPRTWSRPTARATATPRTPWRSRATCGVSRARRPDVSVSLLRFVNFMGPGVDSPLTRYFTQPVLPTVLGFDPRLQFVHEDDAVEVLRRTATEDHPGTFNVAGGRRAAAVAVRAPGRAASPGDAVARVPAAGQRRAQCRAGRVLARAAPPDAPRPRGRHRRAGVGAGLAAQVHHRGGVGRLPELAGGCTPSEVPAGERSPRGGGRHGRPDQRRPVLSPRPRRRRPARRAAGVPAAAADRRLRGGRVRLRRRADRQGAAGAAAADLPPLVQGRGAGGGERPRGGRRAGRGQPRRAPSRSTR
ncbi:NAD-dependent epimerase/dehydratase family protein [Nonomuraea ferruginea]